MFILLDTPEYILLALKLENPFIIKVFFQEILLKLSSGYHLIFAYNYWGLFALKLLATKYCLLGQIFIKEVLGFLTYKKGCPWNNCPWRL